jgi:hypothetical protein
MAGRPFSGLADALEALALAQPRNELLEDLATDAGPILRLCPALSPMVPSLAPAAPLDAADERLRLYEAVAGWLRRMATHRPILVVIDDASDASADLVALLAHVAHRLDGAPVLVALMGRAAAGADALEAAVVELVEIGPLDE